MMVSSLLAFNACTKDGAQGPAGPKGDAGAPGAAGAVGPVGPAGAKGADGVTIRSGDAAPAASVGNDGDFYFDKTAKVLYGPKADGAWPATGTTLTGPAGPAGKDGKNGSSFLAGAEDPTDATGNVGDFYFSVKSSTLFGPKAEDGTWASVNKLPLGSAGAKVYYYNVGFSDVKEVANSKVFGQDIVATYPDYRIFSTYKVTADDLIRIKEYTGWGENREMAFETTNGSGDFLTSGRIPADAADLLANYSKGERFIYTADKSTVPAIFNLSQADIDQLTADPANFDYLTYAKVDPAILALGDGALGKTLNFANVKNISLNASTTKYTASYTAKIAFDLDKIVPNLEKNVQDGGLVVVRAKAYDPVTGALGASWTDLTAYRNQYTIAGVEYGPGLKTTEALGAPYDILGLQANIAQFGGTATAAGAQVVTVDPAKTVMKQGSFSYEYTIASGDASAATTMSLNPSNGSSYYSTIGGHLTATPASILDLTTGILTIQQNDKGKPANFFTGKPLRLISVTVLNAETVAAAQKAGINIEDADALERFISKR